MATYKVIQMTNKSIGEVAVDKAMPFGIVTRKINCKNYDSTPFSTNMAGNNIISINESGYYRVTYSASLVASAAGLVKASLLLNGVSTYSVNQTAAAAGDAVNLTLVYEIRACPNSDCNPYNIPVNIQIQLSDTAISDGISNMLIERVY